MPNNLKSNVRAKVAGKIEQSVAYMVQHLDKPLQVARLAALVNVSPSHFFALFKRHTGCAPIDFFIRLRMRHACRMLDTTSLNVKEVAAALGYEDPFYFSRVFKSVNRIAPSEYRALPRERMESIRKGGSSTGSLLRGNGREANHKAANLRFSVGRAGKGINNGAAIGSDPSPANREAADEPVLPEQHQNAYQTGKEMHHAKLNLHIASNDNRAIE